ncbi:VTT domain-containing protein [Desulfolithobacter sp.]
MTELLTTVTTWIANHPNLAGLVIFLTSFAESLAVIGLLVPGAALMLTAGALIAAGALSFWPTMAWAVFGAVLADGLSYWLGHYYKDNIRSLRIFAKHQDMLAKGESFFHRHGGKSVFFGRFIGPIRPVIPLVAGMLGMDPVHFTFYNVLSALGWAPAYLLPGMAFGASLALAGEVAKRLAILIGVSVVGGWMVFFLSRRLLRFALNRFPAWEEKLMVLLQRSPLLQRWLKGGVLDRDQSVLRLLVLLAMVFVGSLWLFFGITEDVVTGDPLVQVNQSVYHLFQGLRTPWGDTIMVAITMLGDAAVTGSLALAALIWLLWRKDRHSALYLAITVAGGFFLVTAVKTLTHIPRPVDMYQGAVRWAYPSNHATISVIIFGFLALLCSRELRPDRRWLPVSFALVLITGIGVSRLYLGAHWLSDVVGGFCLGTAWLILLSVAYFNHVPTRSCTYRGLWALCLTVLVVAATVHWSSGFDRNKLRYGQRHDVRTMPTSVWQTEGWQQLPVARLDLEGEKEQVFNLQYAGDLDKLKKMLLARDWRQPVPLTVVTGLRWLLADPDPFSLPILPQVHDGRHEQLLLIHALSTSPHDLLVLRFWPADICLDNTTPLWVGTLCRMTVRNYMYIINLPRTVENVSPDVLAQHLDLGRKLARRPGGGKVLLLYSAVKRQP